MKKRWAMDIVLLMFGIAIAAFGHGGITYAGADEDAAKLSGAAFEKSLSDHFEKMRTKHAPVIETIDGVKVQRTPSDYAVYNTTVLNADSRGCNACHEDLAEAVKTLPQLHYNIKYPYGVETTIEACIGCHTYSPGGYVPEFYALGRNTHSLHLMNEDFTGNCMSCHTASENTGGKMELWDRVKYDVMRGITDIPDVKGEFSFNQKVITEKKDFFSLNWLWYEDDFWRVGTTKGIGSAADVSFDDWPISVSGKVDKPFSTTLKKLIDEAPVETNIISMHCTLNPPCGSLITTCKVKGIPFSYILERAGVQKSATVVWPSNKRVFEFPIPLDWFKDHKGYLVYELNGERLDPLNGYPLQFWVEGRGAPVFVKQLTDIVFTDEDPADLKDITYVGWRDEQGNFTNKPNCAIFYTKDGQIIDKGKPFTFEGFADAYDEPITCLEFSMDRGKTWTKYETKGAKEGRWVYWKFTFTPTEETAYVLKVRATCKNGMVSSNVLKDGTNCRGSLVSKIPATVMVNAK